MKREKFQPKVCARPFGKKLDAGDVASQEFTSNQGFDPILGSPNAPVNYQLLVESTNPTMLGWNVPALAVEAAPDLTPPIFAEVQIKNYDSGATVASQSGTTVTLSGGALRFIDTATDVGKKIKWGPTPNSNETATIVTVLSPTTATVAETQTVVSGPFLYLHPNLVFQLWLQNPETGVFEMHADSESPNESGFTYANYNDDGMGPTWSYFVGNSTPPQVGAYVVATIGGVEVTSQNFLAYYFSLAPPSTSHFSLSDAGSGVVFVSYTGPGGTNADRFVAAASKDGFANSVVTALTGFDDQAPLALDVGNLWEVVISLWNFDSTTQLSHWSPPKTITPA